MDNNQANEGQVNHNTQWANEVRRDVQALGVTRHQVHVRVAGHGSLVVTVRDPAVDQDAVRAVADSHQQLEGNCVRLVSVNQGW